MKYLFVTLMWNARAEMPGPGDIFAVCCQSYSPNGMTRYGRYTHLDDMSALTQWTKDAVYHNITVLETAKPRKEILNTVAETFPAYDVLVLWSRKEYELFRQAMHDCGHRLCTAKVVLLEELLGAVVRPRKRGRVPFQQVLRAFHVQTTRETFYQPKYRAGFLLELWDRVSQLAAQSEGMKPLALRPEHSFLRLEPALKYVKSSLEQCQSPRASALAEACAMSQATFRREFQRVMGRSPREYIQSCQLQRARRMLLLSDESITQIALAVGYQDVSGFNRQFLNAFGVPPREYRRLDGDIAQSRMNKTADANKDN